MTKQSKNDSFIHQPHDKLVKKMLSNPATARDVFSLFLPSEILAIADLSYLEMQKDSFIDDEHRAYAVDILYKTKFQNEEGYLWLLLEHQRKSDPWMPVRLFKYIALIWDHVRKASKSKSIPLIYPVVLYNGNEPYAHSLSLSDMIQPPAAREIFSNLFTKPFCLIDLPSVSDEVLRQAASDRVKGIALLMTLKHTFDKNLQAVFDTILLHLLKQLSQAGDTDEVVDVLYYIINECDFLEQSNFWPNVSGQFSQAVEDKMSTIAQQIAQQANEKKMAEIAERLLTERPELSNADLIVWVQRMTGLSADKIKELQKKHH